MLESPAQGVLEKLPCDRLNKLCHPDQALAGEGAGLTGGMGGQGEVALLPQKPRRGKVARAHPPEVTSIHAWHSEMLGEPLVEECVVSAQKLQQSLILLHLAPEEEIR